jgi:hypothetical protein
MSETEDEQPEPRWVEVQGTPSPTNIIFCEEPAHKLVRKLDEHSEQARAPHTNGPRDVSRCGDMSLLQKPLHYMGG